MPRARRRARAARRRVPAPAAAQKVVKIGDLGSKVGVFEGYGKYQTMAIQLAVEELNAKGGVLGHKIEIISEDDETKPAPAVRKAEKLILQDDVKLLIGAVSSGATMAVMDVTKKHKMMHWNSVSCAEFMRTTKFHKYYFSNQPDSRMQANGLAKYILDKMGKRVYIFYTDYAMGQSDGRQFKTALEKLGGEVVGVAGAPLDTKDFSPWFGAINQSNPGRALPRLRGHRLAPADDPAPLVRHDQEVQDGGHRLLPPAAGPARHRRADGGLRPARALLGRTTPTRTCRPSTPSSRRSSGWTPTSWPAPTTPYCSGRPPPRRRRASTPTRWPRPTKACAWTTPTSAASASGRKTTRS